jgi:hypothetical protein
VALEITPSWAFRESKTTEAAGRISVYKNSGSRHDGAAAGELLYTENPARRGRPRGKIGTSILSCRVPAHVVHAVAADAKAAGLPVSVFVAEVLRRCRPDWWDRSAGSGTAPG